MGITEIFRRLSLAGRLPSYGEASSVGYYGEFNFDDLVAKLQLAKMEVDRVKYQLLEEIRDHRQSLIEAYVKKDADGLQIHGAELVLKKKLLAAVITYSRLLDLTIKRVQDTRNIEALVNSLAPLEYVLRAMDDYLAATSPEIAAKLASVVETAERVVRGTGFLTSNLPHASSPATIDPEVQREIARTIAEARREVESLVPEVSLEANGGQMSPEEVDERLLDYIRRNGGVIRLSEAARELGIPREEVVKALRRLQRRGLISVESGREAARA